MMIYFTLEECTRSATARQHGLDNTPDEEQKRRIVESVDRLLDPLRRAWGERCASDRLGTPALTVSSGFRGRALNALVRGSTTSAHCCGYAFDLVPANGRMREFKAFCREFLAARPFDQLISEDEDAAGNPRWMHVGYKSPRGEQRRQMLSMRSGSYFPMT